jgi:hypothetical protein
MMHLLWVPPQYLRLCLLAEIVREPAVLNYEQYERNSQPGWGGADCRTLTSQSNAHYSTPIIKVVLVPSLGTLDVGIYTIIL